MATRYTVTVTCAGGPPSVLRFESEGHALAAIGAIHAGYGSGVQPIFVVVDDTGRRLLIATATFVTAFAEPVLEG